MHAETPTLDLQATKLQDLDDLLNRARSTGQRELTVHLTIQQQHDVYCWLQDHHHFERPGGARFNDNKLTWQGLRLTCPALHG